MAQTYIVKEKDTLSAIARKLGVPINQISGYRSGDPDLIYPGEKLTIGETAAPLSGLGGTLKEGDEVEPTGQERTLPTEAPGNLSVFKDLMKQITDKYSRASTMTGFGAATGILGVKPEAISGRSLAGIVDFVKGQAAPQFVDIYTSTINMMEETSARADKQIERLISERALPQFSDEQIVKLATPSSTYDYEYLMGIKKNQEEEATIPVRWVTETIGGRKVSIGFDRKGKEVQRTDLGAVGETTFGWKNLTQSTKQDIISWLGEREGFDSSWIKKMDEDPEFADFIVAKYYQKLEE